MGDEVINSEAGLCKGKGSETQKQIDTVGDKDQDNTKKQILMEQNVKGKSGS